MQYHYILSQNETLNIITKCDNMCINKVVTEMDIYTVAFFGHRQIDNIMTVDQIQKKMGDSSSVVGTGFGKINGFSSVT